VAPVDLTAFCPPLPPRCPSGHLLRFGGREGGELMPGAFLMGWHSCGCEGGRRQEGAFGHHYVMCRHCLDGGSEVTWYNPPCKVNSNPRTTRTS